MGNAKFLYEMIYPKFCRIRNRKIKLVNHLLCANYATTWVAIPVFDWDVFWVLICKVHLTVCYYHVTYAFHRESTLYSCLNVKELLSRNMHDIWSLSGSNGIRTHNHLVPKRTLKHLAKLAKWLCCAVSIHLHGAFHKCTINAFDKCKVHSNAP